jgi:hypothetical protein
MSAPPPAQVVLSLRILQTPGAIGDELATGVTASGPGSSKSTLGNGLVDGRRIIGQNRR